MIMAASPLCIDLAGDGGGATLSIQCLAELTPLDMMDMSFGISDPTGSCVWLGAYLFMELFSRDLNGARSEYLSRVRSTLFPPGSNAIELGAGSGIAGLSMMMMAVRNSRLTGANAGPSRLVLTDANDDSLELCRTNRDANDANLDCKAIHVEKLAWGKGNAAKVLGSQGGNDATIHATIFPGANEYDTVFATDVLYDLSSLVPLVTTASELLKDKGYFILSHVPRASLDEVDSGVETLDYGQQLETIIIREASEAGLVLALMQKFEAEELVHMIFRPSFLPKIWGRATLSLSKKHSWQKMEAVGAAVLVFQKRDSSPSSK